MSSNELDIARFKRAEGQELSELIEVDGTIQGINHFLSESLRKFLFPAIHRRDSFLDLMETIAEDITEENFNYIHNDRIQNHVYDIWNMVHDLNAMCLIKYLYYNIDVLTDIACLSGMLSNEVITTDPMSYISFTHINTKVNIFKLIFTHTQKDTNYHRRYNYIKIPSIATNDKYIDETVPNGYYMTELVKSFIMKGIALGEAIHVAEVDTSVIIGFTIFHGKVTGYSTLSLSLSKEVYNISNVLPN